MENNGITVLSLFDGISCGMVALQRAGIKVKKYFASEIDKQGILVSEKNHPEIIHIGDVTKVHYSRGMLYTENGDFEIGTVDLLIGGSPCQCFSLTGKRKGLSTTEGIEITTLEEYFRLKNNGFEFNGQSHLFFEYLRLLKEIKPDNFLLENVKMSKKWEDVISDNLGVQAVPINSKLVSAQNRPRLYWSNLLPNPIEDRKIHLKDVLTNFQKDSYHWLSEEQIRKIRDREYKYASMYKFSDIEGKSSCVLSGGYCNSSDNKIEVNGSVRFLNNIENERLQTLPDGYTEGIPEHKRKFCIGNGWTVDVIMEFFKKIEVKQ